MLPKTGHKGRGQCGGQLKVLVSKQQRSDRGIHTGQGGHREETSMHYMMNMVKGMYLCTCVSVFTDIEIYIMNIKSKESNKATQMLL